jgi:AcrR family transcriptional regulator
MKEGDRTGLDKSIPFILALTIFVEFVYLPVGMIIQSKHPRNGTAREAIHAAATALFAEQGYAATSTREICERAGITKPVLYYYFGNKEQLYQELILDAANEYRKALLRASGRGKSTEEKIVNVLDAMFTFTRKSPLLVRLGFRMIFAAEKGTPPIDIVELGQFDQRLMQEIIREGIKKGELHGRPLEIAEALGGVAALHIMDFLITGKPTLDRSHAQRQVDLLLHGCISRPTGR